ncbi:glycosyltransferase family 2 protein [Arcicella lustrica]|uniref:Glycosyltransferase family 2 protein n=1 Tax=Arcicella lustrica TaxID=2984196 RepID=A0ABU5SG68_9BACT|nr:glycosyltransferase family 2 protein [Arcicella sp. DC25W]MEA5426280.1 glycosyltransferase family 2 protein [Arcicella sp. DC25W]
MDQSRLNICILSAAYNEGENLLVFYHAVKKVIDKLPYSFEFCFVNDGSKDDTLSVIRTLAKKDESVKYLSFSRNFGQQIALKAGIDTINADAIIMMDSDLQHPPEMIPDLIELWLKKKVNMVNTLREEDQDLSWFKKQSSKRFYQVLNKVSDLKLEPGQADFRLIDRQVTETLKKSKEQDVFLRGMIQWIGYDQATIKYKANKRFAGESKYTFAKMMRLALAGITSFSIKPLYTAIYIGFFFALMSFLYLPYVLYSFAIGQAVDGWASILMTIAFFGGLNLIVLGVLGIYIGKILIQNKERPLYIIQEQNIHENSLVEF